MIIICFNRQIGTNNIFEKQTYYTRHRNVITEKFQFSGLVIRFYDFFNANIVFYTRTLVCIFTYMCIYLHIGTFIF